jgi:DNA primase
MNVSADRTAEKLLVKQRTRIDELARDLAGCEFTSRGAGDLWSCCPFHSEDTASFHVRPQLGMYKCFGCGESGDVFSFVEKVHGVGFREALQFLAERAGVTLGSLTPEEVRAQNQAKRLRDGLVASGEIFTRGLQAPQDNPALHYMQRRGFLPETLSAFDVGFVPGDFLRQLQTGGMSSSDVESTGFTRQFTGRVSFGIRNTHGALVGFGARTLRADEKPKYVNTRETAAFNKRQLLYGFDKAAREVGRTGRMVIMEGYTDVMMAHQRGLTEAVATMGTSLTLDHVKLMQGRVSNLVLLFDGDRAGLDAAERAVRLVLAQGMECRTLCLPDGQDPCDWFSRHEVSEFEDLLASAGLPTVSFLCGRELEVLDPGQPGGREAAAAAVLEACRTIIDPIRRDGIAGEVARLCGLDRNLVRAGGSGTVQPERAPAGRSRRSPTAHVRSEFVAVAGLASEPGARQALDELQRLGALEHPSALRLAELGLELPGDPIDPVDWIAIVREREEGLATSLERLLFPAPEAVMPSYEEAVNFLTSSRQATLEKAARRVALSQPDLATDDAALKALDQSLRAQHSRQTTHRSTLNQGGAPV